MSQTNYTASQLKTTADEAQSAIPTTYITNLMPRLQAAAAAGLYLIRVDIITNNTVKTTLQGLGYVLSDDNEAGTTAISWEGL